MSETTPAGEGGAAELPGLALAVLAVAPAAAGGVWLRGPPGEPRDRWIEALHARVGGGAPFRRIPAGVSQSRLLGGLDLAATLATGLPIAERGLLAEADGGFLLIAMAERIDPYIAGLIATAHDTGIVQVERDGIGVRLPAQFAVVALDEGLDDETIPPVLAERLGLVVDLALMPFSSCPFSPEQVTRARDLLPQVVLPDRPLAELCAAAWAFGLRSLRPPLQAVGVARVLAALEGRLEVSPADAVRAAALVLAPRAVQMPVQGEEEDEAPPPPESPDEEHDAGGAEDERGAPPDEVLIAAAAALLPRGLLEKLAARGALARGGRSGQSGSRQRHGSRGRQIGVVPGDPRTGARLGLVDTLRAAAPWQRLRKAAAPAGPGLAVRREDFRIIRRRSRQRTTTLFVVDASGSSAMQRLGEAKGAVQILLSECYARRDEVALIAFRGRSAEMVLPPTRALARASRALAGLVGGGGTPLACAIDAARQTCESISRSGRTPVVVLMTDARANIARNGDPSREKALADAQEAARQFAALGSAAILIDTAPKASAQAEALARALQARYVPLPYAAPEIVAGAVARETRAPRHAYHA